MSFKFDEHHSVGVGVTAEYMKAKLQKAVDVPGGVSYLLAHGAGSSLLTSYYGLGGTQAPAAVQSALLGAKDGQAKLDADDWGYGFNLGYMYQLNDATRFGLAYRSSVRHRPEGNANWSFNVTSDPILNQIIASSAGKKTSAASVDVETPESVSGNFYHDLNDKWAVMGDLTWTRHSRMDSIDIKFHNVNPAEGDLIIKQNWKDTFKLSLGANYKYSENLLLRGGVAYDQSPVKNDNLRHPALPDSDRYWFSVGANYKLNKQSSIDLAYSYVFFKNSSINYTDTCTPVTPTGTCTGNGETTRGDYKTNLQFLGVQYNYRF
ncbi:OmpP1/FadL family transporter [Paludibacterium denitrificans]|uniref:OmpP1/FadL family transporter n=1 Tax=Paludibacterium denitrificans TaxID=2675226 RepID=UPI002477F677|nr:OmpP1/FadL family transporter [Paludibacterium denitrificans]